MSDKILTIIALYGTLIALVGCGVKPAPTPEPVSASAQVVLKISGSGTTVPILNAVKPAFEADVPVYCPAVGDSSIGIAIACGRDKGENNLNFDVVEDVGDREDRDRQ